ncbi:phosphatidate cytidylyltransferase [Poseidonocella pacifica]|uniref:Phosphatidate cytidylyltransferase n=1 Tax=Poseidonocella pacifica TaxID=871651 RepID=A0A1I0VI49_9RHOB|nr:phosphatidate cytidylyltransferase [Poseidonocella pacifica]SFA76001.1 phosphatidate cytidylyltransferase [Poseidonocella pacifica]
MTRPALWNDLRQRLASGTVMIAIGVAGVYAGGIAFHLMVGLICGLMAWELMSMLRPQGRFGARSFGLVVGIAATVVPYLPAGLALPILFAPGLLAIGIAPQKRVAGALYTLAILLGGFGMIGLRDSFGIPWILWLIGVVVATDVFGYFAGRLIGGPKFWPRVSPKKTWSGTIAGWIASAIVAVVAISMLGAGWGLVGVSIAMSMASQMGDVAESALKRRVGVKDASSLIPGHGGLMDRFDGMIGAALFLTLVQAYIDFPPGIAS